MSYASPVRTGWHLTADGLAGQEDVPEFALPGAEKLKDFSALLGLPELEECRTVPFSLPGLLPDTCRSGAVLSRQLRFGAVPPGQVLLHFPMLRGSGRVLLDNAEIALFTDGPLTLDLTAPARRHRRQLLELCFDPPRPAGIPAVPFFTSAQNAHFVETCLVPDGHRVSGSVLIHADEPGTYFFTASAPDRTEPAQSVTLGLHEERRLSFSCAAGKDMLTLLQIRQGGLSCDRRVLLCGTRPGRISAWLPLSREECLTAPERLAGELRAFHIGAVGLSEPAAPCLYPALCRAGIRILQSGADPESRADLLRFPGLSFSDEPCPEDGAASVCLQLCGMTSCRRTRMPGTSDETVFSETCGTVPPPQALAEFRKLLFRLRLDGAALGIYSGPLAAPGALTDPELSPLLEECARPHIAMLPLFGAWYAGSLFSCKIGAIHAPDGSQGTVRLFSGDTCLKEIRFTVPARPVPEVRLPDEACTLLLKSSLALPDGTVTEGIPLPVPVGKRAPLQSFVPDCLNMA